MRGREQVRAVEINTLDERVVIVGSSSTFGYVDVVVSVGVVDRQFLPVLE